MKRIDALKGKLKAAKAELTIRYRQFNAAQRGFVEERVEELPLIDKENEIESLDEFEIPTFLRRRGE